MENWKCALTFPLALLLWLPLRIVSLLWTLPQMIS